MSLNFYLEAVVPSTVFEYNITHNLGLMARKAGIYNELWRPEELRENLVLPGSLRAKHLIEPLEDGLHRLCALPEHFKKYSPDNGWGTYDSLVKFVKETLEACKEHPEATIRTSR